MADANDPSARAATGVALRPTWAWALTVLVWVALQSAMATLAKLLPGHATNVLALGVCELVVLGGASLLLSKADPRTPRVYLPSLAFSKTPVTTVLLATLLGLCVHPVADWLRGLVEKVWVTPEEQLEAKLAVLTHDTLAQTLTLFVVIVGLGPFLEELFYRGVIFTRVRWAAGLRWAAFVSAGGFVFAHGDVRDWPSLALVAWVLTWLRARTGALWASVACHAVFNASTIVWMLLDVPAVPGGFATALLGALSSSALVVLLARRTAAPR